MVTSASETQKLARSPVNGELVYLGVGSNEGDRGANCERARRLLEEKGIRVVAGSSYYETEAMTRPTMSQAAARQVGSSPEPPYLNGVLAVETELPPERLLDLLEGIERELGRRSKEDWAPRPVDLDILFYGGRVVRTARLTIPHPGIPEREFVLKPLLDIAPDLVHPVFGKTIRQLAAGYPSRREREGMDAALY